MHESPAATPIPAHESAVRELRAAREIAHAFLTARSPDEVYRLALERVAPVVRAAFGCVYLRESDDVLRLVAAWNWPAEYRAFLGEMRVRVGLVVEQIQEEYEQLGAACVQDSGELVAQMDTVSAARDMDVLRAVLGDERRAMQLFNPGLNGQWATTNTLIAAVRPTLPRARWGFPIVRRITRTWCARFSLCQTALPRARPAAWRERLTIISQPCLISTKT